jgi:branched-chain amino acid transport system substrate-binding protein
MKLHFIFFALFISFSALAKTEREIHIGLASNFSEVSTGSSNPYGGYFKDGVMLAAKKSENRLRDHGIKLVFDDFDYGTSDIMVLEATRQAIASNVIAVVGYNYSSNALLAAPLHQQAKLPMLTPSASANRLGTFGRYIHMGCFDNKFMGEALAQTARVRLKARKAIVLPAGNCAYCSDLADSFEAAFKSGGGRTVLRIPVLLDDKDFSSIVKRVKETDFDVVLVPNQELTSARMIAALAKGGIKKPFLGADGWGNVGEEFFAILSGVDFTGYSVTHWHPGIKNSESLAFVEEYQKSFGKIPNDTSVLAYDSTLLLVEALLKTKEFTREGLEDAINSIRRFDGITGKFAYRDNKPPTKSLVILRAATGKFEVIDRLLPEKTIGAL